MWKSDSNHTVAQYDSDEASIQFYYAKFKHTSMLHIYSFIFHIVKLHANKKKWRYLHQNCTFFPVLIVETTNDVCWPKLVFF